MCAGQREQFEGAQLLSQSGLQAARVLPISLPAIPAGGIKGMRLMVSREALAKVYFSVVVTAGAAAVLVSADASTMVAGLTGEAISFTVFTSDLISEVASFFAD